MISKEGFILGKEEFVDYLNFIKDQYKKQDTLISAFETLHGFQQGKMENRYILLQKPCMII